MRTCVPSACQLAASHRRHAACSTITTDQPIDVPPDVALLLPEPDDGALPVLKPLELPELLEWLLDPSVELDAPDPELTSAACRAAPGRTNMTAPAAATPLTPTAAVSDRTTDLPRSLATTARETLLRFIVTPRNSSDGFLFCGGQPRGSAARRTGSYPVKMELT